MIGHASKKYILIDVVLPTERIEDAKHNLAETVSLIKTYGDGTIVKIIQRRAHPHPGTYIGTGKAAEIADIVKTNRIDTVIVNGLAKSTQLYNLLKIYWDVNPNIEVWDRVDLILHIFAKHAQTAEAKLQIELASLRHMGPRMYGLSEELGRQAGGIGTRGAGETNIELMKRHWRNQMKKTSDQLDKLSNDRQLQLERRRKQGFRTVSIVGYTNAGKTSLFNVLANKQKLTKDVLFATLDSVVGHLYFPDTNKQALITDTIGFIRQLPPSLIDAFKSTLMESINADLLLHVIDAADPRMYEKIQTVEHILSELKIENKPIIQVFNKIDVLSEQQIEELKKLKNESNVFISANENMGIEKLKKIILQSI